MISNPEHFKKNKYLRIDNIIPLDLAKTCTLYAKAMEATNYKGGDFLAPNSHSVKDDFLMESLLILLTPKIEAATGLSLSPTYSYYRVYKAGEKLIEHVDRQACEVSVSLCLGYDYQGKNFKWRIAMDKTKVALEPGDAVIYRGIEVPHSRSTLQIAKEGWHAQVFLHYIDNNGPYTDYIYDGRPALYTKTRQKVVSK
jgi:hypothetical protein